MVEYSDKFIVKCNRPSSRSQKYDLKFPFNKEIIDCVKLLDKKDRTYKNSVWTLSIKGLYYLINMFKGSNKIHFDFGSEDEKKLVIEKFNKVRKEIAEHRKKIQELDNNKKFWIKMKKLYEKNYQDYSNIAHSGLLDDIKLYPHQIVGTLFLNDVKSALISLEMGLGKTIISIAYVELNEFEKVFVVTPNSLKFNFYGEIEKFTNSKAHIVNWKKNKYSIEESKYIIVNYEFFSASDKKKMDKKFKNLDIEKIDCVIADECHRLKNNKSNTYKNFKRIFNDKFFRDKPSKVFLSGTPAPNRAYELYTILNQISSLEFATKTHFYEYFCGMTYDPYGYGYVTDINSQKLEELFHKISPFTYRKRKEEVLDLPEKIYQNVILEMTPNEEKVYSEIEQGVANDIFSSVNSGNPLTILVRLRQYTSALKIAHSMEIIDGILQEGGKIVIIDQFKDVLRELHRKYPLSSVLHTGDEPDVEVRADMVKKFQDPNSDIKIFLGSIATCNYGLTLTAANKMIILTLPYSVGEYDQVSDRIHRINQKWTVHIYPLIFRNTIDEIVFETLETKRKEIKKVIDNENYVSKVDESVMEEIIRDIRNKYE